MLDLLPVDHPLRNTPLKGFKYKMEGMKGYLEVTPNFGIAKKTYNELSNVWKEKHLWFPPDYSET